MKNSMLRKGMVFAVIVLFVGVSVLPSSGSIGNEQVTSLVFEIKNVDEATIEIIINAPSFDFDIIRIEKDVFTTVELGCEGFTIIEGEARLPCLRRLVEIPHGSFPDIVVTSVSWESTLLRALGLPTRIVPVQPSILKNPGGQVEFVIDESYYAIDDFMPRDIAKVVETGVIRGRRFALVEIHPMQYTPSSGELNLMKTCQLIINLPECDMSQTYEKMRRYTSPDFEKLFKTAFDNYGFYEEGIGDTPRNQEGYLIIVYDNFYDEIQPLATWKQNKGFDTTVTKTSEIPGGPTKENIRSYIEDAYNNWATPPSYILLVGDTPQIPTFTGSASYSEADLYYVTVDGSDYFPDIHIGRFPAAQESHVEAMVDKTVYYEQGIFPSNEWIKKAAFLASTDRYWVSEGTHNYVIDNYLDPNGYTCDKLYTYTYGATTQDVHDAINDGRSLVIYSGHGGPSGWGDGPPFYKSDVQALMNENMYPFVCSHACSTNTFGDSECFGETWLREADKAGLAFWGASASTLWDEDDILEKGMFQAWWDDGLEWIGGMTDMALIYLYENYSGGGYTQYYFEAYNVNGDPSVRIWSDDPSEPPETPTKPDGPTEVIIDEETTFTTSTTDPEGDQVYYMWDWGDGAYSEWLGPYSSGQTVEASHTWTELGEYGIRVKAKDTYGAQSEWSEALLITVVENEPPEKPTITGPKYGKTGKLYEYTFVSTDPEGHDLYYIIWWDDGHTEYWIGPYKSGEEVTLGHAWSKKGKYIIKAKAKDIHDAKSPQASFTMNIIFGGDSSSQQNSGQGSRNNK